MSHLLVLIHDEDIIQIIYHTSGAQLSTNLLYWMQKIWWMCMGLSLNQMKGTGNDNSCPSTLIGGTSGGACGWESQSMHSSGLVESSNPLIAGGPAQCASPASPPFWNALFSQTCWGARGWSLACAGLLSFSLRTVLSKTHRLLELEGLWQLLFCWEGLDQILLDALCHCHWTSAESPSAPTCVLQLLPGPTDCL